MVVPELVSSTFSVVTSPVEDAIVVDPVLLVVSVTGPVVGTSLDSAELAVDGEVGGSGMLMHPVVMSSL